MISFDYTVSKTLVCMVLERTDTYDVRHGNYLNHFNADLGIVLQPIS